MDSNTQSTQQTKTQFWSSIIYPNRTITIEYIDKRVKELHIPCIISPLHNRDSMDNYPIISGLRNEIIIDMWKKKHYHIMFMFPRAVGLKTYEFIKSKLFQYGIELVGSENVFDGSAMARYFCHLDNLEKAQYKIQDLLFYGGLDLSILHISKFNPVQEALLRDRAITDIKRYKLCDVNELDDFYDGIDEVMLEWTRKNIHTLKEYTKANYQQLTRLNTTTKKADMLHVV